MLKTSNLKLYLPMEGNTNDVVSGATYMSSNASIDTGKVGKCYNLNGSDDSYINLENNASLKVNELTLSFWVYPIGVQNSFANIIGNHSNNGWVVQQNGTTQNYYFAFYSGGWQVTGNTINIHNDIWTHCAIVKSLTGGYLKLYRNGILVSTNLNTLPIGYASNTQFYIGKASTIGGRYFKGKVDEVLFFNKALSDSDIQRIMMGLHPLNG